MAESLGFTSVWARDHLLYHPHGFEDTDPTFFETFSTLTYIGARTQALVLGTAATIPTRHPLHLAQVCATITRLLGPNRLIIGLGSGGFSHEFDIAGLGHVARRDLVSEQADILKALWSGEVLRHNGEQYKMADVATRPFPVGEIPLLYAGTTPAAVRIAATNFDGWLPGRLNLPTLKARLDLLRELFKERARVPVTGIVPLTSIDSNEVTALRKIDLEALLVNANSQRFWLKPQGGSFTRAEELTGSFLYGDPAQVTEQVSELCSLGLDHLIFDLRLRFDEWQSQVRTIGEEILPRF